MLLARLFLQQLEVQLHIHFYGLIRQVTHRTGDTVVTLTPGLHTVFVTDDRGCTASDTVFMRNPDLLAIAIDPSQTILPYCEGVKTAQLGAIASGGTLGYTYLWDDNAILPQTSSVATGLLADNYNSLDSSYTVTVTDSKGCIASVSTDVLRYFYGDYARVC